MLVGLRLLRLGSRLAGVGMRILRLVVVGNRLDGVGMRILVGSRLAGVGGLVGW